LRVRRGSHRHGVGSPGQGMDSARGKANRDDFR
jgi:hypothetical protein